MLPALNSTPVKKIHSRYFFSNLGPRLNGETQSPIGAYTRLAGRLLAATPLVHPVYNHAPAAGALDLLAMC